MPADRRPFAVGLAATCAWLDLNAPQPLLPELARYFAIDPGRVSLTLTMTTLAVALAAPWVGGLADQVGRKAMIVGGVLLLALPTASITLVSDFDWLLVLRFIQGLLLPAIFTVTVAYVGEEFPPERVPGVVALYTTGAILGGFLGRLLPALMADSLGWRSGFVLLAGLNVAGGLTLAAFLPRERNFRRSGERGAMLRDLRRHLANPLVWSLCAVGFLILFSIVAALTYAGFTLAAAPFHLSTAALGWITAVFLLGMVTTPLAGRLIARVGIRGTVATGVAVAMVGLAATLLPFLPTMIGGLALMAAGVFICQTTATSFLGLSIKQGRSAAMGLYISCYYLGGSFGAVAPAPLWGRDGWGACVALICLALGLAAVLVARFWHLPAPAEPEVQPLNRLDPEAVA